MSSAYNLEPFEYDQETLQKKHKKLTKNQHLYGDDWEESDNSEQQGLQLQASLPKSKFVESEVI